MVLFLIVWFLCAGWLLLYSVAPHSRTHVVTRVLARIGLVAFVALPLSAPTFCDFGPNSPARKKAALLQVANLDRALAMFHSETGRYPDSLSELVASGLLRKIPDDPWNKSYEYSNYRSHVVLRTLGADHRLGGEGADADIDRFIVIDDEV